MLTLQGKHNIAKIFTDVVDEESISQVINMLNLESLKDSQIRMMPDIHAGKGCTVGTTITLKDKVIPSMVGVDIGCGMLTAQLSEKTLDLEKLDTIINTFVPAGHNIHNTPTEKGIEFDFSKFICPINTENAAKSIGSLGGGNHFIEVDKDNKGNLYLVVHSGSRHLGLEVCNHYQEIAYNECNHSSKEDIKTLISTLKSQGRHNEIEKEIKKLKDARPFISKEVCHLSCQSFSNYIHDMKVAQEYATLNRQTIMDIIVSRMSFSIEDSFTTIHNYIDTDSMILRKGSVSAKKGEKLLIPINMRDGSLICKGKGNPDWNYSAPHGAGRLMSRGEAKRRLSMESFTETMKNIYSTSVCESTLDEAPFAYKSLKDIADNITDTVDIVTQIKPIYNFKAH